MAKRPSNARLHILQTTVEMLDELRPSEILINELAARANVGIPTIYYHFESKDRLMALAQVERYERLVAAARELGETVAAALEDEGASAFWDRLEEYVAMTWQLSHVRTKLDLGGVLSDPMSDAVVRERLISLVKEQHDRWMDLLSRAQARGWIATPLNLEWLSSLFWSASLGQALVPGAAFAPLSPPEAGWLMRRVLSGELGPSVE